MICRVCPGFSSGSRKKTRTNPAPPGKVYWRAVCGLFAGAASREKWRGCQPLIERTTWSPAAPAGEERGGGRGRGRCARCRHWRRRRERGLGREPDDGGERVDFRMGLARCESDAKSDGEARRGAGRAPDWRGEKDKKRKGREVTSSLHCTPEEQPLQPGGVCRRGCRMMDERCDGASGLCWRLRFRRD